MVTEPEEEAEDEDAEVEPWEDSEVFEATRLDRFVRLEQWGLGFGWVGSPYWVCLCFGDPPFLRLLKGDPKQNRVFFIFFGGRCPKRRQSDVEVDGMHCDFLGYPRLVKVWGCPMEQGWGEGSYDMSLF